MKYKLFIFGIISGFSMIMACVETGFFCAQPNAQGFCVLMFFFFLSFLYAWFGDSEWKTYQKNHIITDISNDKSIHILTHIGPFPTTEQADEALSHLAPLVRNLFQSEGYIRKETNGKITL